MELFLELAIILLMAFLLGFVFGRYLRWREDELRVERVLRKRIAQSYFEERWSEKLQECDDAHVPGDCILCGADN